MKRRVCDLVYIVDIDCKYKTTLHLINSTQHQEIFVMFTQRTIKSIPQFYYQFDSAVYTHGHILPVSSFISKYCTTILNSRNLTILIHQTRTPSEFNVPGITCYITFIVLCWLHTLSKYSHVKSKFC